MKLVSFVYNKQNGENARKRFIAQSVLDSDYLGGFDLEDNSYKNFLRSRIYGEVRSLGDFDELALRASKIVTKSDLFKLLQWDDAHQNVFKDLGGNVNQLAKAVYTKCGKNVFSLDGEYFLLLGPAEVILNINTGLAKLAMKVREGVIEYFDGDTQLTLLDFTRRVLGVTK